MAPTRKSACQALSPERQKARRGEQADADADQAGGDIAKGRDRLQHAERGRPGRVGHGVRHQRYGESEDAADSEAREKQAGAKKKVAGGKCADARADRIKRSVRASIRARPKRSPRAPKTRPPTAQPTSRNEVV